MGVYDLKKMLSSHLDKLRDFHFSFSNPLFWLGIVIVFLVMLRFWHLRKSLSFSLITGGRP